MKQNPPKECEAPSVSVPLAEATAVSTKMLEVVLLLTCFEWRW